MTELSYRDELIRLMKGGLYNGVGIQCNAGSFVTLGKTFDKLSDAKKHIDSAFEHLKKSIKK